MRHGHQGALTGLWHEAQASGCCDETMTWSTGLRMMWWGYDMRHGPQGAVMKLWHEALVSVSPLQQLWWLSSSPGNICCCSQHVQPILSMLIDNLWWFMSWDSLESDASAWTHLLWPTLLQKQLQREEVLVRLAVPETSRNPEWAWAWTARVCLTTPSDASVSQARCQHFFQCEETEKSERTEA